MRFYIIAGEASGDLHASNLIKAFKKLQPDTTFRGFGGDRMLVQGVEIVKHYRETAFMGFWEVLKNLGKIFGFIEFCRKDILAWKPDAIILVDYPGFNLRIAEFAKKKGFKVFYYISPQVWAWKSSRVKKIRRDVDRMFVILPFEKEFYKRWNYDVEFVGHPLLDELSDLRFKNLDIGFSKPVVALLPGSRKQEITKMLPVMISVRSHFPDYEFVVAGLSSVGNLFYESIIENSDVELRLDETYSVLKESHAALVTSGTATMEAALFNVPQVVCYKGSALSYMIGRRLIDVKYIAMANLILERPLVKELIQQDFNSENLKAELYKLLQNEDRKSEIQKGYSELKEKLGRAGASEKTAKGIISKMK